MTAALAFLAGALGAAGAATLLGGVARDRAPRRLPPALALLARLGARVRPAARAAAPRDLEARIVAAGRPGGIGVREAMAAKAGGALAAALAALPLAALAPGRLGPLLVAAAPAAGFLAPDAWLARRAATRARRVRRELPGLLDLLRVSVEAGLSPSAALAAVGGRASGPLARDWRAVAAEVELGVPLSDALAAMRRRLPLPEVDALAGAIERSARHGTPLARALSAQARDARLAYRRSIEEAAARAGPKIQLVVALLIVPSVMLLVAAALAVALLGGGGAVPVALAAPWRMPGAVAT